MTEGPERDFAYFDSAPLPDAEKHGCEAIAQLSTSGRLWGGVPSPVVSMTPCLGAEKHGALPMSYSYLFKCAR